MRIAFLFYSDLYLSFLLTVELDPYLIFTDRPDMISRDIDSFFLDITMDKLSLHAVYGYTE